MKRKAKKHVVVSDMYDTIYSDVVMEDLKELYPDASDELRQHDYTIETARHTAQQTRTRRAL